MINWLFFLFLFVLSSWTAIESGTSLPYVTNSVINKNANLSSTVNYDITVVPYEINTVRKNERTGIDSSGQDAPNSISGGKINARYCNGENTDIFNGILYRNDGHEVTIEVDPVFEKRMETQRRLRLPLPITPVYDLVVTVIPNINRYCLPEWDENGNSLGHILPPLNLPFKGYLKSGNLILLGPGNFTRDRIDTESGADQVRWRYVWRIKGWPNGITSPANLERLIEIIKVRGSDIKLLINDPKYNNKVLTETGVNFSLCVPVAGSGRKRLSMVRGDSSGLSPEEIVDKGGSFWEDGLNKFEPYKSNANEFSINVDLGKYPDSWINDDYIDIFNRISELSGGNFRVDLSVEVLRSRLESSGSCPGIRFIYSDEFYGAFATIPGNFTKVSGAVLESSSDEAVAIHEFSHAFAGLNDEYIYKHTTNGLLGLPLKNCSINPSLDYLYNGKSYGLNELKGCSYNLVKSGLSGGTDAYLYRPSDESIMNGTDEIGFNVISCGYIMQAIKGGSASSYWPLCSQMSGIVLSADTGGSPTSLVGVSNLKQSQVGQVISSVSSSEMSAGGVVFEKFLANGEIQGDFYTASNYEVGTSTTGSTTPSQISAIGIKNSSLVPPNNIFVGSSTLIGGFNLSVNGGPFFISNLRFKVDITGRGGGLSDISNINLYESSGKLISANAGYIDDRVVFSDSFTIGTSTDYFIKGTLSSKFKKGQTIILSGNLYKDDTIITEVKTGKDLVVPKNNFSFSKMTVTDSFGSDETLNFFQKLFRAFVR